MPKIVKANGKTFTFEDNVTNEQISSTIDEYFNVKKKVVSKPTVQEKQLASPTQQKPTPISSDTEEIQPLVESDGLGGLPKSFPKRDSNIKSVMYGDGMEQQNVLVQSLPLGEKPKKYYRLVSEQKKEVDKKIAELEDRNTRLGRRPEDLAREGTYQSLIQNKQQLDSEFKPAELAISEIKKATPTWTRPIERIISSATDGKYSLANTETIKLNKEVEDRLIDSFDDAPEETRQKWYKGSLPLEQKEKIINNAKVDVLNNTFKSLKQETSDYLKNIKDNPSISDDEKNSIRTNLVNRSDAFNAQVALDFSGNLLKNNFKRTGEDKNLDEAILSKYEGFIPESADAISRLVEGAISVGGKVLTGIPTLALLGAEQFNQFTGTSKPEDYTPIEATIDLINDTTNYNFLPSSKSEKGAIVGEDGEYNWSYRSITRTLADALPFTLQIINSVKKGRVEGSPQYMVSQLLNPSKNKAFSDNLRAAETAYKVTINDNYKEAKDLGMDDSKAFTYANVLSLAEGVSESIMPDFKYFDSLTGATLKTAFKGNLKEATTKQAVKNVTKDFFKNVGSEIGEEEFSLAVEDGLKYSLLLNHKNSEFFNIKKQKELLAATVIMSGAIGGYATPGKFTQNKTDIYNSIHKNIYELQDSFNNEINSPLTDDKAKETLKKAYMFASEVSNAISNAPENVTSDQIDLLVKKKSLEEKKKTIDTAFHPDINDEITVIDEKIRELSKKQVITEEAVSEPVAENTEKKVERLRAEEQAELKEALPNAELKADGKIDVEKLSLTDAVAYDDIYNKYDKLISPLLKEIAKPTEVVAEEIKPAEEVVITPETITKEVTPIEEVTTKPITPKEIKSKYDVTYDDNGNITKITTKKGVEVKRFIEYKNNKGEIKLKRNPGYTQIEARVLGFDTDNKIKVEKEKAFRKALDKYTPTTEYEVALEALAKGIKVSNPKQETGDRAGWVTNKKADSIEVLAEKLATDYPDLDEQSIRDELIDIINSNSSLAEVRERLVSTTSEDSAKLKQQEADAFLSGLNEKEFAMYEAMKAENDYISELSDEEVINYYQELYKQQDEGQIDESTSAKGIGIKEISGEQKERSVLKRIKEGGNAEYINEIIDKIGVNYTQRNQQQVIADAEAFVDEVGIEKAYEAIKNGSISNGDSVTVIYASIIDRIPKIAENAIEDAKTESEKEAIQKEYNELLETVFDEFSKRQTDIGQATAILNALYIKNQEIMYSLSVQKEKYKAINAGVIDEDTLKKFEALDKRYSEANKKIKELESKLKDATDEQNFKNIIDEQNRVTSKENIGFKARNLAKDIRSGKKAILPSWAVADGAKGAKGQGLTFEKTFAKALETFADVHDATKDFAKAIDEGLKILKQWYTKNNVDFNEGDIKGKFSEYVSPKIKKLTVVKGVIKIPSEIISNYVANGGSDINELSEQILNDSKDEYPNLTVRQIKDQISNYGSKLNKSRSQLAEDILRLKSLGRLESQLEDLKKGISNAKNEVKKRALSDLEKKYIAQIKAVKKNLGIEEIERTTANENYVRRRIEEIKEKIKNNDFAKKEVTPITESEELKKLKTEKNRVQEEYDKIVYTKELENRTVPEKISGFLSDMWDAQRVTRATGELSFVGAQGGFYMVNSTFSRKTFNNLIKNFRGTSLSDWTKSPIKTISNIIKSATSAETIIEMFNNMGTKNNYDDYQSLLKAHPYYDVFVKSKLRLLSEDIKTQVRDEMFIGNHFLHILKLPFTAITKLEKGKKKITLQGYYEKLKTGKVSEKNIKTTEEIFDAVNPLGVFERGNNTFMNMARVEMFMDGVQALEVQGKNPIDHLEDYKKLASAVNTITGTGNLSQQLSMALPVLNKIFFSPRFWAASLNITPPISLFYLAKLGNYDNVTLANPKSWGSIRPTVAQKAFVKPMLKGFIAFYGMSALVVSLINSALDDDDEMTEEEKAKKRAYIEYDPRSSDFMQVVSGDTKTDFFGPYRNNMVLFSRLFTGQTKKDGNIIENGAKWGSRTDFQIGAEYIAGKANPFPGMFVRYSMGKKEEVLNKETNLKENKRMLFDDDVSITNQTKENLLPIFVGTVKDIVDEDPVLGSEFYTTLALFGKQTSVYKKKEKKTTGRESSGNRSESGSRESSGTRTQSGNRE
jgi:hypothetical protein